MYNGEPIELEDDEAAAWAQSEADLLQSMLAAGADGWEEMEAKMLDAVRQQEDGEEMSNDTAQLVDRLAGIFGSQISSEHQEFSASTSKLIDTISKPTPGGPDEWEREEEALALSRAEEKERLAAIHEIESKEEEMRIMQEIEDQRKAMNEKERRKRKADRQRKREILHKKKEELLAKEQDLHAREARLQEHREELLEKRQAMLELLKKLRGETKGRHRRIGSLIVSRDVAVKQKEELTQETEKVLGEQSAKVDELLNEASRIEDEEEKGHNRSCTQDFSCLVM